MRRVRAIAGLAHPKKLVFEGVELNLQPLGKLTGVMEMFYSLLRGRLHGYKHLSKLSQ